MSSLPPHFFRQHATQLTHWLVLRFGLDHIEDAEDIVQDTLETALLAWEKNGLPDNPAGWLRDVARKKVINWLQRKANLENRVSKHWQSAQETITEIPEDVGKIQDQQLRMILACCHPDLAAEHRIALALKSLCGLSVQETASALLTNAETMEKRLYRARQKFKRKEITLELPADDQLDSRLDSVFQTLYLLFNEGYFSNGSSQLIREELCLDAIRLMRVLTAIYPQRTDGLALLALMLFHAARLSSRADEEGLPILLTAQDRSLWDRELISEAMHWMHASQGSLLSAYHLKAGIAAEHCSAASMETTNWEQIADYYALLELKEPSFIVTCNRAVALHFSGRPDQAQALLKSCPSKGQNHYLFWTVCAFTQEQQDPKAARSHYEKALTLTDHHTIKAAITQRVNAL